LTVVGAAVGVQLSATRLRGVQCRRTTLQKEFTRLMFIHQRMNTERAV